MFELRNDPKGFIHLTIGGKVDDDEMREGLEAFLASLKADGKTDFLYTINGFEFPALSAIAIEFGYIPRLFAALPKIGKVAVVAEAGWLRGAAEVEGFLIPGMTIETFTPAQTDEAEAWLLSSDPSG